MLQGDGAYAAYFSEVRAGKDGCELAVLLPKADYDKSARENALQIALLAALIAFAAITCCVIFSRAFITPLKKGFEQIRRQEHSQASSEIAEIDDLFAFLAEQDRLREEREKRLEEETDGLKKRCDEHETELKDRQTQIDRLAYSRKNEVDPDDYEAFKLGLKSLTKTERTVFRLYLEGKTANEISELLSIRESTLKYHNHNILEKLNVSSRKQMLRYAALLKQEQERN